MEVCDGKQKRWGETMAADEFIANDKQILMKFPFPHTKSIYMVKE